MREAGADVPAGVAALIDRCLEKNPDARPQSAHELLASLEGTLPTVVPQADRRRLSNAAILALVSATVMIVGTGAYLASRTHDAAPLARTVAVLPLLGPRGDSLQQELADGLSDEIAASLSKVAGLRVVSRRGAGNYRGQRDVDLIDIGKRLGAAYLLTGSMHESNDSLKVLAQLLDASDRTLIWAEPYHRAHGELDAIRDAIARAVGDTLRRIMGVSGSGVSSTAQLAHPVNPEAYRLYVLAQRALTRRGLSLRSSIDMFSRATELDTLYAQAYAGLSVAVALSPYFEHTPVAQASKEATRAAERALHLDATLAQPHIALGLIHEYAYEWERAGKEFQKAVALDGHDVEARVQYGRLLLFRDRPKEALGQLLAARNEDPASALVSSWVAYSYYVLRQQDSALVESTRASHFPEAGLTGVVVIWRSSTSRKRGTRWLAMSSHPGM